MTKIQAIQEDIQELLQIGASRQEISDFIRSKTKLKETQVRFWTNKFCGQSKQTDVKIQKTPTEHTVQYTGNEIINVENLLNKCQIDRSKWEVGKFTLEEKHVARKTKEGIELHPKFDIRAWLQKKSIDQEDVLKDFIEKAAKHSPKSFSREILFPNKGQKEFLFEVSIFDAHLSKLVWGKECGGEDYDIKIATDLYKKALEDLVSKAPLNKIDRIIFPVGNDFFNSDNELYTTTAGTPQHDDSRWQKSFSVGCELLVESIEKLSAIAPVDVIVVAGNHDRQKVFYLGEYLNAWFKNSKSIKIDNSPNKRKYFQYGQNLLGFCHGNEEKHEDLPLIMAREQPKAWGECKHYRWAIGHYHHVTTKDYKGVIVDILPSLCAADEYHSRKGFVGNWRGSQAFLFHKEDGLVATYYHSVKP